MVQVSGRTWREKQKILQLYKKPCGDLVTLKEMVIKTLEELPLVVSVKHFPVGFILHVKQLSSPPWRSGWKRVSFCQLKTNAPKNGTGEGKL